MDAQITKQTIIEARRAITDMSPPRRPIAILPAALARLLGIQVGDIMVDTLGREMEVVDIVG